VGDVLPISKPRNNFPLDETADHSVLLAGGIGITPIICMARRLSRIGAKWSLYLAARSRSAAAFLHDLRALEHKGGAVFTHFDDEHGGVLNVAEIVRASPPGAHLYCCGPVPMLAAFKEATQKLPPKLVHLEYFSAEEEVARTGGFEVILARQGRSLLIPPGNTILEVLIREKINVPFSCSDGVCGTCETRVLEGVPDHRDSFLTEEEKISNASMMVCCSGAKTSRLILDL
jgi:vanillate O-demethylase ferredoxin subunit